MKEQDKFYDVLREKISVIENLAEQEFSRQTAENPAHAAYLNQKWAEIRTVIKDIHQRIDRIEQMENYESVQDDMSPEEIEKMMEFYQKKYLPESAENQDDEETITPQM